MTVQFYAESFSPFCERARWALDHHGISYREVEQVPMLAEITLRIGVRRFRGPVTVPLLVTVGERIMSSHEIARWAERHGTGSPLFLPAETDELEHWITVSDQVMNSGRALLLARMMTDDGALSEQLPRRVPGWLRRPLRGLSRMGVIHLRRKYSGSSRPLEEHERELRARLEDIRVRTCTRIRADGAPSFSYADITLAASLQFVCPVADSYVQLGPATRAAWNHPALALEFADLLEWRDRT